MMLIFKNIFNFQSGSYNEQLFGIQCCFRPSPKVILLNFNIPNVAKRNKKFPWDVSSDSILKWLSLYYSSQALISKCQN